MTTTLQRLLDLVAAAPAADEVSLLVFLREAHGLYHQGFTAFRHIVTARVAALSREELAADATAAGMPGDPSQDRDELVLLLVLAEWEGTPAALAYTEMTDDAARRGVSLIPEE
ncbi:hypothetical protein [Streptomyces sp. NPDC093094]|uniref:hypothetical protein n=1 Tax=Streptomyces sp. NPDC093094 TaxID=3366026 RepID=UPI00381F2465